jgi:hypothetical protein
MAIGTATIAERRGIGSMAARAGTRPRINTGKK